MTTTDRLRALADAATAGAWTYRGSIPPGGWVIDKGIDWSIIARVDSQADAAYIAAVDPDTLRRLIDLAEGLAEFAREWHYDGCSVEPCNCVHPELAAWDAFQQEER